MHRPRARVTFGSQDPPDRVSDQNAEESPAPGATPAVAGTAAARGEDKSKDKRANLGGAGEDSQATGQPQNAG